MNADPPQSILEQAAAMQLAEARTACKLCKPDQICVFHEGVEDGMGTLIDMADTEINTLRDKLAHYRSGVLKIANTSVDRGTGSALHELTHRLGTIRR